MKLYYVYILECADSSYYIGVTNNIERRFNEHEEEINKNCYTVNRRPLKLVFCTNFNDPTQAIAFEKQIKGWTRKKKQALINKNWEGLKQLSICHNKTHFSNNHKKAKD